MSSSTHAVAAPENAAKAAAPALNPARLLRLQRTCSCGGNCESCKKKEPQPMLQRKAIAGAPPTHAAPFGPRSAPASPTPARPARAPAATPGKATPALQSTAVTAQHTPPPPAPVPKPPAPKAAERKQADQEAVSKEKPKSGTPAITEKKKAGQSESDLPTVVRRVLDTPGEPLEFATRTSMEARFGRSFRDVRIHTDALAAESARAVYAHAYTVGEDIVFDSGQYQPRHHGGSSICLRTNSRTPFSSMAYRSSAVLSSVTSPATISISREKPMRQRSR